MVDGREYVFWMSMQMRSMNTIQLEVDKIVLWRDAIWKLLFKAGTPFSNESCFQKGSAVTLRESSRHRTWFKMIEGI